MNVLQKLLPGVKRNIPLAPYTSFHIGGKASYFYIAKTKKAVAKAIEVARKNQIPFFVLGGGTNLLVSDRGYQGLVIKMQNASYHIQGAKLYAEAGVPMSRLVYVAGSKGLAGLEWAGGLPGTVGGAVRGNAGAFRGEIKDSVVKVEALDERGRIQTFSKKKCRFGYRTSLFKEKKMIVFSAAFLLKKGNRKTLQRIAADHIRYRKEHHPLEYGNAGSVFKNCDLKKIPKKFLPKVQNVIKTDPFPIVPTAFLISEAGLKGMKMGDAEVSLKHPNYIVNKKHAKAKDVIALMHKVKKSIKKKFSLSLEEEIQLLE